MNDKPNLPVPTLVDERGVTALVRKPALVPQTMTEAIKLAELMAASKLVPAALQKSAADCLMVVQQAIRWDMDPFAVAQECSVIQGKLMYSGKIVAAVVNTRGNLSKRLSYEFSGENGDRTITVRGTLCGETEPREVEVVLRNAKTNNSVWQKQPDQQLMYHGARVWARRHMPELMLGVWAPEEFAESASVKDGWPNGDLAQIDDYSDGVPERETKEPEQKTFSRNPAWQKLQTELDAMVANGAGAVEIFEWGNEIEHKIRNWPPEPKRQWLSYVAKQVERVVENTAALDGEIIEGEREGRSAGNGNASQPAAPACDEEIVPVDRRSSNAGNQGMSLSGQRGSHSDPGEMPDFLKRPISERAIEARERSIPRLQQQPPTEMAKVMKSSAHGEIFDEPAWLDLLKKHYAATTNSEDLRAIKDEMLLPAKGKAGDKTWKAACALHYAAIERVTKETNDILRI